MFKPTMKYWSAPASETAPHIALTAYADQLFLRYQQCERLAEVSEQQGEYAQERRHRDQAYHAAQAFLAATEDW